MEAAVTDAVAAALPAAYSQWAADGDFPRMTQAVADRKGHVRRAQQLLVIMGSKASAENAAARRLADAEAERTGRAEQVTIADSQREQALQTLSDHLEAWAAKVGPDAPTSEVRTDWVEEVLAQADAPAPVSVLGKLLGTQWLTPATTRLREQAAAHEQSARQRATEAGTLTARLRALEAQTEPEPSEPARWTRRPRPVSSDAGAPLWRLLDPAPGLPNDVLDRLEAALDATGLLDAWVSPDGVYVPDRDGHDSVVHLSATLPGRTVGTTLGTVLVPAANAGALTAALTRLLAQVAYRDAGQPLPDSTAGGIAVSGDGRWVSSARCGTAGPGPHGAELIGTAAQTAKRDRDMAALRGQIEHLERQQQKLADQARNLRDAAAEYDRHAQTAPDDGAVVAAAHGCLTAARELDAAERTLTLREGEHRKAAIEADEARSTFLEFTTLHQLPTTDGALRTVSQALEKVAASRGALELAVLKLSSAREHVQRAQETFDAAAEFARTHRDRAEQQRRDADEAQDSADSAEEALGQSEKEILTAVAELDQRRTELAAKVKQLQGQVSTQQAAVGTATERLTNEGRDREAAEAARQGALTAWWVPVDAGLAAARAVPDVEERNLSQAVRQARAAREQLRPASWPDSPDASADKDNRVNLAYSKMAGTALIELRAVLEANGGRTASVQDADDSAPLPAVTVLVDSSGVLMPPHEAADRLAEQASKLRQQHDDKMQQVLVELLSSTFVEHLREQLKGVVTLLGRVNGVLEAHPTGANRTQLRLERQPALNQTAAFNVLNALEQQFVDGDAVQEQIRGFLEQQIREAQELGRTGDLDWKEHLAQLLDYRQWFDVVTKYRVHGDGRWKPLTAEVHAKDSGGGKVVTLLQPLLATVVALYDESDSAPRPLWLDEAFTGVDDINRSTMLDLLVEFDLDFLLAGPAALVTAAQVPSAAAWFVTRAPAPDPGVDLSLMLWAGNRLELLTCPTVGFGGAGLPQPSTDPDRPSLFDAVTEP
jgi:hypothetical protein